MGHFSFCFSLDQLKAELLCSPAAPADVNHSLLNHRPVGTRTSEVHHNQRNRRQHSLSMRLVEEQQPRMVPQRHSSLRGALDYYSCTATLPRTQKKKESGGSGGERYLVRDGGRSAAAPPPCPVHQEAAKLAAAGDKQEYAAVTDDKNFVPVKNGENYVKDGEICLAAKDVKNFPQVDRFHPMKNADNYAAVTDVENFLRAKERELPSAQNDAAICYPPPVRTEVRRQLSLREGGGTVRLVDRHGSVREVRKYSTLREGDRYAAASALRDIDKYATIRGGCYYGSCSTGTHHREPGRISSFQLQPPAVAAAAVSTSRQTGHPMAANGVTAAAGDEETAVKSPTVAQEGERSLSR